MLGLKTHSMDCLRNRNSGSSMSENAKDILVILGTVISALGFVSWGSKKTRDFVSDASDAFLDIKVKIRSSVIVFLVWSGIINIGSGSYFAYAIYTGKEPAVVDPVLGYLFIANCAVFIIGVILYFINIPVRVIHSFLSWTVEHNFENRWKYSCIFALACLLIYTIAKN